MNHAITIGGLLLSIGVLIGFVMALVGLGMFGAAAMSDDTSSTGNAGCATFMFGAVIFALCLGAMVSG